MITVSIEEIQRDPAGYLQRVNAGETMLVMQGDRAIAEIKPVAAAERKLRPFGLCAGEFTVPADFDAPLPDAVLAEFEGE